MFGAWLLIEFHVRKESGSVNGACTSYGKFPPEEKKQIPPFES
ncbi:hypothetical protein HMPREF1326_01275 [Akkermansia sp. KLE1605]|nr:hypothetical protein HMPREF1326_01275 [Akkermansia sp. KLE1605]